MVIAERLAQLRRERHISQDALAVIVGASQATVSRWEDPDSLSTPSAVEIAELAEEFEVDPAWLLGSRDERQALPVGSAIIDQTLLEAFGSASTAAELKALLGSEMTFGTIWVEVPSGAEIISVQEAMRRVKEVDRRLRKVETKLWREWAALVLR